MRVRARGAGRGGVRGDEINGDTWQFLEWGRAFEPFIETFAAPPGAARPGDSLIALGNLGRGARFLPHLIGADGALVPLETTSWTGAGGAFQIPSGPVNGTVAGPRSGWYRFMILDAGGGRAGSNAFGLEIANPAEDWRRAYFAAEELLDAGISGDSADPDLDDMPTLAEYIFGTDPREGPTEPGCCVGGVRRGGLRVQARAGAGC